MPIRGLARLGKYLQGKIGGGRERGKAETVLGRSGGQMRMLIMGARNGIIGE